MTHVTVIDVDLGSSIDELITADISTITDRTKQEIATVISDAKSIQSEKAEQSATVKRKAAERTECLNRVYTALLEATTNQKYLQQSELLAIANPHFTNIISLLNCLRTHIRKEKGNEYVLVSSKIKKASVYQLTAFNVEPSDQPT